MDDCFFCKITDKRIPSYKIYEDETFFVFLDIRPVNLGHALIATKKHYRNASDMPDDILAKLGPVIKKIYEAVKKGMGADGVNVLWNNEGAAGQLIFHAHIHVVPRFTNDGFRHWSGKEGISAEDFKRTAELISSAVNR